MVYEADSKSVAEKHAGSSPASCTKNVSVAELADAQDLGSCAVRYMGSTPIRDTTTKNKE